MINRIKKSAETITQKFTFLCAALSIFSLGVMIIVSVSFYNTQKENLEKMKEANPEHHMLYEKQGEVFFNTENNAKILLNSYKSFFLFACGGFFILFVCVLGILYFFLRTSVIYRLKTLLHATTGIKKENFDLLDTIPPSNDEIGKLTENCATLAKQVIKEKTERDLAIVEEKEKMKSFISIASHQLRTPLTGMRWILEILRKQLSKNLTKEQKTYLQNMAQSNERMIRLVNEILDISKIESKNIKLKKENIPLFPMVRSILEDNMGIIQKRNITVRNQIPKNITISADKEKIEQVLQNLIGNAIKYSQKKVIVSTSETNKEYRISVLDDGMGVPEEQKDQLFQKFFRADNAKLANIEGSGLGLYIAKMNIEAHGGKIWHENIPSGGSLFIFTIKKQKKHTA